MASAAVTGLAVVADIDLTWHGRPLLMLPSTEGPDTALLYFDNGRLTRFSAQRHKGVGHGKAGWGVDYSDWHPTGGIVLPRHIEVTWADKGRPWFRFDSDGFAANLDAGHRPSEVADALPREPTIVEALTNLSETTS